MDLRLLGPVEALIDGRPVALGAPKQRAVLAMLALEVGRPVSTDRLIEGLWGEQPPASAPKMVQLYVSHLRRLVHGNGAQIVTRGRGYELQLAEGEVDVTRFERLVEQGHAREALTLWRSEPLADMADEPFAAAEMRRLDELRLRAVERAIDADLATGRHSEVIGELDALIAQHPLRERLHAQRMLALYRSGRQAEALAAYHEARATLVEQIGVEPGGELRRLQRAILVQDPALNPASPAPAREAPHPVRPRGALALAAAAVLLLAGLAVFGISRLTASDGLAAIGENAVGVIDPDNGRITARYAVGRGPAAVVTGGGSVWVANALDGTVSRIDRGRDQIVTIPVGGRPTALAFGAGSLWVADGDSRSVMQVDPGTNAVVQRIEVANIPRGVAVAGGALWVASGVDGAVHRIDLDRLRASRSIAVGANPTGIAAGAGAIWTVSEEAGTVTRIEPRSGTVVKPINVGNGPSAIAVGEGAVWVANRPDGTLSRIDPATNVVSWTVHVGRDPAAVTVAAGAVWVAGAEDGTIARVDPRAPRVLDRMQTGNSPTAIAATDGDVWVAGAASAAAHRGGTLRVLIPEEELTLDWISMAGYRPPTEQLTSLAYDGLVAYRRVGSAAGATLVGGLATSAPAPSRDGRTYVFTLRPRLHYSDGRPVRPEDFRASIERFLRATRDVFPTYFVSIVGAERCMRTPAHCDLSSGIETDARARTITVHLTRPDGDFLHKLTLPFAYVVPADTPDRRDRHRPPPGTGPYRVSTWDLHRGGELVRNPYFRSWSPDRPAGFADRIEVHVRKDDPARQIADVQRGAADLAVIADQFSSALGADSLASLAARAPGQVHSAPAAATDWMFLNVRRRPFDDVRVRRALSLAIDRARIVDIAGGSQVAAPTCQVLPSGFPGYQPHCPYTAQPTPGRGWTAPDFPRASRLVAQSGRTRERVTVWVPNFQRRLGRYFVSVLDALGFRASLRVNDTGRHFGAIYDPRTRAQIGFVGWASDFVSPSNFIGPNFTCASLADRRPENASHFCDRALARQFDRALAAQGAEAAELWAAADRRIVDRAAAVPMTNHRAVVFVSKRVGNVQNHIQWSTLLDQLWVR
jgi:YVTN family beta-propeller protein